MSTHQPSGSAHDMVQRCFRHQTPDAYGRKVVPEPSYAERHLGTVQAETVIGGLAVAEEVVGNGETIQETAADRQAQAAYQLAREAVGDRITYGDEV